MRKRQLKILKKSIPGFHGNGKGEGYEIHVWGRLEKASEAGAVTERKGVKRRSQHQLM